MQDQPTSVVGRRVAAFLIDSLVYALVTSLLWFAFADRLDADTTFGGGYVIGETRYGFHEDSGGKRAAWGILSLLAFLVIYVLLPGLRGTSPGRALMKIRLVKRDGGHPGIGRALLRYIIWIADAFPYIIPYLTGLILTLTTKGNQRLGDMAAGTYTVRADAAGQPIDRIVPALASPGPGFGYSHVPPPQYGAPSHGAPAAPYGQPPQQAPQGPPYGQPPQQAPHGQPPQQAPWGQPPPPPPSQQPPPPPSQQPPPPPPPPGPPRS